MKRSSFSHTVRVSLTKRSVRVSESGGELLPSRSSVKVEPASGAFQRLREAPGRFAQNKKK